MKHEITTELRNTVIEIIANAVITGVYTELTKLLRTLHALPVIEEKKPEQQKDMTVPGLKEVQDNAIPPRDPVCPEKK